MPSPNQRNSKPSRCQYCSSTSYGKGCKFGPHGIHVHLDNLGKCIYCGSGSYGKGCKLNPTSDLHIHGINYNSMFREEIQSFIDYKIVLRELHKKFTEFECYKLGIINENGDKIKAPVTEQEAASFSPMTKLIIKIKKHLGSKTDLLEACSLLESSSIPFTQNVVYYTKLLEFQKKIEAVTNSLYQTLDEAQAEGIALDDIKSILKA